MASFTIPGIAVITGASSGIGRACAIALSHAGWTCVVSGRRLEELEITKELGKKEGAAEMRCVQGDLSKREDVERLFEVVRKEFGESLLKMMGCHT